MHSTTGWKMVASISQHEIDCKQVYNAASEISLQLLQSLAACHNCQQSPWKMLTYLQTLPKYLSKIKRNCEQLDANQKWRTFVFNIKIVPYCSDQHILKAASFTMKVKVLHFQFHYSLEGIASEDKLPSFMQTMGNCG